MLRVKLITMTLYPSLPWPAWSGASPATPPMEISGVTPTPTCGIEEAQWT